MNLAVWICAWFFGLGVLRGDEPTFVDADLSALNCKVVREEPAYGGVRILDHAIHSSKIGGEMAFISTSNGTEELRVQFTRVDTELVPMTMESRGPDRGPETVRLTDVEIE